MFRIDDPNAVAILPTPAVAGTPGYFTAGNPSSAIPATVVTAEFLNQLQEELMNIVAADPGLTPSKTTNNQVLTAIQYLIAANGAGRTRLTGSTSFFVDVGTGNDANNGLATGSGHAWATLQHAINVLWNTYDFAGFAVTVSLAAGTYTGAASIIGPFTGGGSVKIQGNGTCILSSTTNCLSIYACASVQVAGLTLTTSGSIGLYVLGGGNVSLGSGMIFGACALAQMLCEFGGVLNTSGAAYSITGGGTYHLYVRNNGAVNCVAAVSATVTITGSPAFSTAFVAAEKASSIAIQNYTWSGAVTAGVVPYSVTYCGVINGVTGLPGSGAAVQNTGGQFS